MNVLSSNRPASGKAEAGLVFFGYLLFFVILFNDAVFGDMTFFRRDISRFYYPMWHYGVESIKQGVLPLWNPYVNFGQPFLANVQTCALYPFSVFFYTPDFLSGFNFFILFHLALAAFFTYLWVRKECGLSASAALAAGFAYSLSGYLMSAINLTIALVSVAYFPLVLLCFRRALTRGGFLWKSFTAIALLFQYLGGDPSIIAATTLVIALFGVFLSIRDSIHQARPCVWPLFCLLQIGALFAALSAFQSFLFVEFIRSTDRVGLPAHHRMVWSMLYNDWIAVFVPFFSDLSMYVMDYWARQSWLENYYLGVTTLMLAVAGVWRQVHKPHVGYHVLLAVLGIALPLGSHSLIYGWISQVYPPLTMVRYPIRFYFIFTFAVACLAGFGLDRLAAQRAVTNSREQLSRFGVYAVVVLLLAAGVLFWTIGFDDVFLKVFYFLKARYGAKIQNFYTLGGFADNIYATLSNLKRSLFFLGIMSAAILAARLFRVKKNILACFFILMLVADLGLCNPIEPRISRQLMTAAPSNIRVILKRAGPQLFRILASPMASAEQGRVRAQGFAAALMAQKDRFISNSMMLYGLQDSLGYDSLYLSPVYAIHQTLMELKPSDPRHLLEQKDIKRGSGLINCLNIRYIVSPNPRLPAPFRIIHRTPGTYLYQNNGYLPRAFLVKEARVEKDSNRRLGKLAGKKFDPLQIVYLEEAPQEPAAEVLAAGRTALAEPGVEIVEYSAQKVTMKARVPADRPWLFFADAFYPGWVARVDGKITRIYRANHAFRAIAVAPGTHDVTWTYEPLYFKMGVAVTLATVLGLCVYYVCLFKKLRLE